MADILYHTTANLPTNPRLLKEIDLLSKEHNISVLIFKLGNWSESINQAMMTERSHIHFFEIDVTRKHKLNWAFWGILEKLARIVWPLFKRSLWISALAHTRRSIMLLYKVKKLRIKPDYIVAHNLGALFPTFTLSKQLDVPFIYDIEDYDPGIAVPNGGRHYIPICELLMRSCLPSSIALTCASPLIGEYTLELIGGHPNHQVILNSFPSDEFQFPSKNHSDILKLVWFSQKISFGRGIEQLIDAFEHLDSEQKSAISLTLIGDIDSEFQQQIIEPAIKKLNYISLEHLPPMKQLELHKNLANYDVGLALEFNNTDLNRQLCLTNKILAYTQAGLFILATDTPAQRQFMEEEIGRGLICGQNSESIAAELQKIMKEITDIQYHSLERFNKGKSLSWEKECNKIKELWKNLGII